VRDKVNAEFGGYSLKPEARCTSSTLTSVQDRQKVQAIRSPDSESLRIIGYQRCRPSRQATSLSQFDSCVLWGQSFLSSGFSSSEDGNLACGLLLASATQQCYRLLCQGQTTSVAPSSLATGRARSRRNFRIGYDSTVSVVI
jgi:hypothetical protein